MVKTFLASPLHLGERALRRGKFRGGAKAEPRYCELTVAIRERGKPPKTRSEKSRSMWRNDPGRDEKICIYINKTLRSGQALQLSKNASDTVYAARKNLAQAKRDGLKIVPMIGLPHWDHCNDRLKAFGWALASERLQATPFTLRLSEKVIKDAMASKRGIARYLQDRIARHLRTRVPDQEPCFWFAIERGFWEEAHLHGAVVIPKDGERLAQEALRAAGGPWTSPARQCQLSRRGNLVKWLGYATKWLHRSAWCVRGMGASDEPNVVMAASQPMRRVAKTEYQTAREKGWIIEPD